MASTDVPSTVPPFSNALLFSSNTAEKPWYFFMAVFNSAEFSAASSSIAICIERPMAFLASIAEST